MGFSRQEYWSGVPLPSPVGFKSAILLFYFLLTVMIKGFPGGSVMEKAMVTHSSTLAWKIPWTEEPDRLQSMGS